MCTLTKENSLNFKYFSRMAAGVARKQSKSSMLISYQEDNTMYKIVSGSSLSQGSCVLWPYLEKKDKKMPI